MSDPSLKKLKSPEQDTQDAAGKKVQIDDGEQNQADAQ